MFENNHKRKKIAVIGAGIAGLSCATQLKKLGHEVEIYEKSRGPSGRMSTRHGDNFTADHGAQYFTARNPQFIEELNSWIENNVAAVWEPKLKVYEASQWRDTSNKDVRYVGIPNMNSPGKYLAQSLSVNHLQTITSIEQKNNQWTLHSQESGEIHHKFDWLILAIPAPQVINLCNSNLQDIIEIAKKAHMKACFTLMSTFNQPTNVEFDAAFVNNEIISWICKNNSKPGRDGLESWTIHTNPEWSEQFADLDLNSAQDLIIACAQKIGLDPQNAQNSIHRWRYANGFIDSIPEFLVNANKQIGACGDWLHGGRVEGAWLSGHKLANVLNT